MRKGQRNTNRDKARYLLFIIMFCLSTMVVWKSSAHAAYRATLYGNTAPVGTTDLDFVEYEQPDSLFSRSFTIPYNDLESIINAEIKKAVEPYKNVSGTEVCATVLCPDVHWEVQILSIKFNFTYPGQPQLTAFGSPDENGVAVAFHTEARLTSNVRARVWQEGLGPLDETIDLNIVISMKMDTTGKFKLYPVIDKVEDVKVVFSADPTVRINDLEATLAKAGAKLGAMVGFTPLGIALGGPPVFSSVMAVFGATAAADMAEEELNNYLESYVADVAQDMQGQINNRINAFLDAKITQAKNVKDEILNSPIPVVGKSLNELQDDMGLSLDVRTFTPGTDVETTVTVRFSGKSGNGRIAGKVRIPKAICEYQWTYKKQTGALPMVKLKEGNTDLKSMVGQSCSQILQGGAINRLAFLGATPPGTNMPNWKGIGALQFTGNLKEFKDFYECSYEITGLPDVGVVRLDGGPQLKQRIPDHNLERTYLVLSQGNNTLLFDNHFKPITTGAVFGGKGRCRTGGAGGGTKGLTPDLGKEIKDFLDPDKCPECVLVFKPGTDTIKIIKGVKEVSLNKTAATRLKTAIHGYLGSNLRRGMGGVPQFDEETMQLMQGESQVGPGKGISVASAGKTSGLKAPDLVVDKFWVESVKPGEKIPTTGKIADKTYLYFNWKVRNIGDDIAAPSKLKITCVQKGSTPCPTGISNFNVTQLWPRPNNPNDPAGAQVFWNQTPIPSSSSQKYRFTATVDPDNKVSEKKENNNTLVSHFDSRSFVSAGMGVVSRLKPAGKAEFGPKGKPGKEKGRTPAAKITRTTPPVKIGTKLAFKGHNILKTLNKTAGKPFDLVFPVINSGDEKSDPVQYTVTCRVLSRGANCPAIKKIGTIPPVGAKTTGKIELKGLKFKPGLYEIAVSLRSKSMGTGVSKKVRLNITSAVKPGRFQGITPGVGGGKKQEEGSKGRPQIRQIQPVKPSEESSPQDKELPRLRLNTR